MDKPDNTPKSAKESVTAASGAAVPPAAPTTAAAAGQPPTPVPTVAEDANKPLLILIEDDPLLTKMYKAKFTKEGFRLLTATDGESGYKLAMANKPDFMILDVMMPKMSGLDLLAKLRQDPAHKDTPVVMLTNLTQKQEAQRAIELGAKEYLIKSNLTPSQVIERVRFHMGKK